MSICPASVSVKGASKLMSWVSPTPVLFKHFCHHGTPDILPRLSWDPH